MSNPTYFITQADINAITDLSINVDTRHIIPFIDITQDVNIRALLCDDLYDALLAYVAANDSPANTAFNDLLPYVKKAHSYYCYAKYAIRSNFQSTPSGFRKKSSDQSESPSGQELSIVFKDIKQDAEHYAGRLTEFLGQNQDNYPQWRQSRCNKYNNYNKDDYSKNQSGFF